MAATTASTPGLTVVLADDFSGGFKTENWGSPFHGGTYWNGMFEWSKDDVAVRNGAMEVTITRHGDGSWTTGGFNSFKAGKAITYGKIEFDGKVEEAQGTMGVFLTWPLSDDNWPLNGEIDILETPGGDVMHTTHWEDAASGEHWYDSVRNQSYDETQWNHYELTWLPDRLVLEVNDKIVAEWTDPAMIPDVAHGIGAMGMVASDADGWMGGAPNASTPDKVTIYMDNVVMSQWDGKTALPVGPSAAAPPPAPVSLSAGSGSDTLVIKLSQDAYQGSAQYTVSVDGKQIGGTFTASAWRSAGQSDTLTLKGEWGPGEHKVEVNFLNDGWGGSAAADRNLHVDGATYNGAAVSGAAVSLMSTGAKAFAFTEAAPPPASKPMSLSAGSGSDTLVIKLSQDAYQGSAEYTVSVDGKQIGGTFTASALKSSGQSDTLTLKGEWGPGEHKVEVNFLNDGWGGSAAADRNLYVDGATYNGAAVPAASASLMSTGAKAFAFTEAAPPPPPPPASVSLSAGSGPDSLVLKISQDAYQGSAQYTVSVDGAQVGGTFTATALKSSGLSDTLTLKGDWAAGVHKVEVKFLNDAWGGSAAADRNLHVDGATYNGAAVSGAAQEIGSDWQPGGFSFTEAAPTPPSPVQLTAGSGSDTLVLKVSQDAYQGSAQYTVSVDGAQVGGVFTASAWHSAKQSDTLTLKGDWAAGAHKVEVKFLNDAWGGTAATDRNLHVDAATYNGAAVSGAAQGILGSTQPGSFSFTEAPPPVVKVGTGAADLFDAETAGGVFTGGGGRDLFVFEAGDGHVTIKDFASRTDKLVFVDFDQADVSTAKATEGGVSGLLVSYGDDGSVFLAGVTSLAARDMVFA